MNKDVFTEVRKEMKKRELKQKISMKLQNAKAWIYRNKEWVVTVAPVAFAGITTVCKVVVRRANLRKQEQLKDLYCYDRSLGHYWRLKRELSNKEWLEIDKRKKNGERLADILAELKVLK